GPAGKWPQNLRVKRELLQSVGGRWRTCGNFFRGIQLVFHTMRCILRLYQSHRLCRMACRIGHAVIKFAIYDGPKLCKLEETILHIEDATAFSSITFVGHGRAMVIRRMATKYTSRM